MVQCCETPPEGRQARIDLHLDGKPMEVFELVINLKTAETIRGYTRALAPERLPSCRYRCRVRGRNLPAWLPRRSGPTVNCAGK
jgi:hypothetical protein